MRQKSGGTWNSSSMGEDACLESGLAVEACALVPQPPQDSSMAHLAGLILGVGSVSWDRLWVCGGYAVDMVLYSQIHPLLNFTCIPFCTYVSFSENNEKDCLIDSPRPE